MDKGQIRILIVDDEEKIRSRIGRILSKEGYIAETASNGTEAREKLRNGGFDITLTDINLPDTSGFEIMEFIRSAGIETLPLVLTGYASVESAIRAIKVGAYDFIQKPVDMETLKLVVFRAAERVMLARENKKNLLELEKLNELKDEFLSVVSHDLRSPLASIGAYANYLLKKGDLTHTQESYISIIREISNNLYTLVNELLDISRIEAGALDLNREETDIAEIISASINNFLLLALDKSTAIDFINRLEDRMASIDRVKFLQVMNNLVSNAVKFTENGRITVSAQESTDNSSISIIVEDTGVGIPGKDLPALFEKYSFQKKGGTRGETGTGLGLVICKRFIELHGGRILARSTPGQGSEFEIIIPRGIPQ